MFDVPCVLMCVFALTLVHVAWQVFNGFIGEDGVRLDQRPKERENYIFSCRFSFILI